MKNYMQFTEGEITIFCGENAKNTVAESMKLASAISKSDRRGNILYINTVFTTRKILAAARLALPPAEEGQLGMKEGISIHNIYIGELCNSFNEIADLIESENIKYVIINSWEFANRCYMYKEKSIFGLRALLAEGVTILVYSQSRLAKAGKIQRSGLGKLAALADDIIQLEEEQNNDIVKPLKTTSSERQNDITPDVRNEMLVASEINELDYAREEIAIASGGELVLEEAEMESEVMEEEMMEI